jgi:hydroxymethylbilane synthase
LKRLKHGLQSISFLLKTTTDVPTQLPPDLTIGAILAREDPRDALVVKATLPYRELAALPEGAVVGTSSVRRAAQLARAYPRLRCANVRGNVGTRLAKLDAPGSPYAALVLAAAGLRRLQLGHRIVQLLDARHGALLHAVGQGALAVEVRAGDARVRELVRPLVHVPTMLACLAERSLMRTLEGGCSVPIGVETEWADDGREETEDIADGGGSGHGGGGGGSSEGRHVLVMRAIVVSVDGAECAEATVAQRVASEEQADEFGRVMARRLIDNGAADILRKITLNRAIVDA